MTKILHRLFFIPTFSFPVLSLCFFWPRPLQPHVKKDEEGKNNTHTHTHTKKKKNPNKTPKP